MRHTLLVFVCISLGLTSTGKGAGTVTGAGYVYWTLYMEPHMNFHRNCKQNFYTCAFSCCTLKKIIKKKNTKIKAEDLRGQGYICPEELGVSGRVRIGSLLCCGLLAVVYHVDLQLKCCQCPRITPCYGTQVEQSSPECNLYADTI